MVPGMSRSMHSVLVALAVALPGSAAAADARQAPTMPSPTQPTMPSPTQPTVPGTATAPAEDVSDAEIITLLEVISDTGVDDNRDAQKSVQDRQVKKYADRRMKHAKAAKKRQTALRNRHKLKSEEGKAHAAYKRDTHKDLAGTTKGREYDLMYIDDEIETLTNILDVIDRQFMPYVDLPALRTEVQLVRTEIDGDLKEAEKLRDRLTKPAA